MKKVLQSLFTVKSILIIILIFLIPFVYFYSKSQLIKFENENNKELSLKKEKILLDSILKVKEYTIVDYEEIGLHKIILKTKFERGRVLYIFSAEIADATGVRFKAVNPYPKYPSVGDRLTFNFYDKDGFVIANEDVFLNQITNVINNKGIVISLTSNGEFNELNKDLYLKIKNVDIGWRF